MKKDLKITLDKNLLNNKDLDFFHYGKEYDLATTTDYIFKIVSYGELKVEYQTKNGITRNYDDIIRYYVKDNIDYFREIDNGNLNIMLGNWFEIEVLNKNGTYLGTLYEECFGSIRECLEMLKKAFETETDILMLI